MATNNPHLTAIRGALNELRRATLLDKAPKAETVATLTLTLLEEFDRRLCKLETSIGMHGNLLDALGDRLQGIELELRGAVLRRAGGSTPGAPWNM